jgi:hypothetical protein
VTPPHVVIVGGGFAGLYAAKALRRAPVRITLIDRRNFHLFQPMLYQVASAALESSDIASPIRSILRHQRNVEVLMAEAKAVNAAKRTVRLDDGSDLNYDYLLLAPGTKHSYFGHDEWEVLAPGLKSVEDALEIRRRILTAFESAEMERDAERRRALLTFVIVGGGATGVEVAGALAEIRQYALRRDFRRIDPRSASIVLLEGGPRLIPPARGGSQIRRTDRLGRRVTAPAPCGRRRAPAGPGPGGAGSRCPDIPIFVLDAAAFRGRISTVAAVCQCHPAGRYADMISGNSTSDGRSSAGQGPARRDRAGPPSDIGRPSSAASPSSPGSSSTFF